MRILVPVLISGLTLAALPALAQDRGQLDVTVVKYDGLKDAVLKHRGKVVAVDVWSFY